MNIFNAKNFDENNEKEKELARILVRNVNLDILDAQEYVGTSQTFNFNIMKEEYEHFLKIKDLIDSYAKKVNLEFSFKTVGPNFYMVVENKK